MSDKNLTFLEFSSINRDRCTHPQGFNHSLEGWSISDWMIATLGELGEAANVAKKLNRVRDGIPGNDVTEIELKAMFKNELADTFIYLDLLAQAAGFTLVDAAAEKFDTTSRKVGYPHRLVKFYGLYRDCAPQSPSIKEADFFVRQGGLTDPWGKAWEPVYGANTIGEARRWIADKYGVELSTIYDGET